jgi:hypothetical protein
MPLFFKRFFMVPIDTTVAPIFWDRPSWRVWFPPLFFRWVVELGNPLSTQEQWERYKTPWLVTGSVKDEITERGFAHVFRPNNKALYDANEQISAIELFKEEPGRGPKKVGMLYEGNRRFEELMGYAMNAYGAQGYSNMYVIYDALERAGSPARNKIRDALATTNITRGPALIMGYQKIAFDRDEHLKTHYLRI